MRQLARALSLFMLLVCAVFADADCIYPSWDEPQTLNRVATGIGAVDLDGDQWPDLIGNTAEVIFVALNDGTGLFPTTADVYSGAILSRVVTGDFTGDGTPDLAFGTNGALVVLPGFGDGTFGNAITTPVTITPMSVAVPVGGSGAELFVFDGTLKLLVRYTNDGSGHFVEASRRTISLFNPNVFVPGDFDGDGVTDAVVGEGWNGPMEAYFGETGGAFGAPVSLPGTAFAIAAADMNADGRMDLLAGNMQQLLLLPGEGRTFSDPAIYAISPPFPAGPVMPNLTAGDFTGDGNLDVAWVGGSWCGYSFVRGTGTGQFAEGLVVGFWTVLPGCVNYSRADLTAADFDRDGRLDLALAGRFKTTDILQVTRNRCGDSTLKLTPLNRLISAGDSLTVYVSQSSPYPLVFGLGDDAGQVSIIDNGKTIAASPFPTGWLKMDLSGLSTGTHELVAAYEGDRHYEPVESAPVTITVTDETTTTTITAPDETPYGHALEISATVTASSGPTPNAPISIAFDDVYFTQANGPTVTITSGMPVTIGPHTIGAYFLGDATQPPSRAIRTYSIVKQTPPVAGSGPVAAAGRPGTMTISLAWTGTGDKPTGTLSIGSGSTTYDSKPLGANAGPVVLNVPVLPSGTNTLIATYSGDGNYAAATAAVSYVVGAMPGESINARGTADGVTVIWNTTRPIVARSTPAGVWTGTCCPAQPWSDVPPLTSSVYLYRMASADGSATSADVGMRISFTDDSLVPGTVIRAVHLQEIVDAANILRTAANLDPLDLTFTAGTPVKAADILALRASINEARTALGAYAYPFTGTIAGGLPVRANDIQELREAIR